MDAKTAANSKSLEVGSQTPRRRRIALDKSYQFCAAANCFNAHRTGSGIKIEKGRTGNPGSDHIEERFAQPIAGWPRAQPRRSCKNARTKLTGNDPHRLRA